MAVGTGSLDLNLMSHVDQFLNLYDSFDLHRYLHFHKPLDVDRFFHFNDLHDFHLNNDLPLDRYLHNPLDLLFHHNLDRNLYFHCFFDDYRILCPPLIFVLSQLGLNCLQLVRELIFACGPGFLGL